MSVYRPFIRFYADLTWNDGFQLSLTKARNTYKASRLIQHGRLGIQMKALVLAGGYATRLRPLSFTKPKLLFPIAGQPMLERTLSTFARIGVDNVILAVNYMADELKAYFGSHYRNIRIQYSRESQPLGTGGPIRLARKLIGSRDPFLAMNGDILFDGNLSSMLDKHKKEEPVATIAVHAVADASRFGLVNVDDSMWVSSFLEKPSGESPVKGLINAGIYIMSPAIFDYIPPGRKISVERDVFPTLAKEGKLLGYELDGYWTDIGTIHDYLETNFSFLKMKSSDTPIIEKPTSVSNNAILKPPCLVAKNAVIEDNAVVGPLTVVGRGSVIEDGARVEKSVLFDDTRIGKNSIVSGSVIGDGSRLLNDVILGEGTVLAAGVTVSAAVRLGGGVNVCPHKHITQCISGPANIL